MIRRTWCLQGLLLTGVVLAVCSGCGPSKPVASGPQPTPTETTEPAAKMPGPPAPKLPGPPAPVEAQPTETTVPAALPAAPSTPNEEVVKAEKGVGLKGRSLDEHEGFLVTPVKAYFAVREKAVFEIQIPGALNLYKASNDGKAPQTFAEFEEQILKPNRIKLPTLPPGATYEWDAENEQLNVRRPVK